MKTSCFTFLLLIAVGCTNTTVINENVVSPSVYERWEKHNSYYALIEIIDAHLANRPDYNRATKTDVKKYLGEPNFGMPNQDEKKELGYQGFHRHVPYGDKVIFTFNTKDELIEMGWVSE